MTKPIILDVRRPEEFEKGHADNSVNIPLNELENRLEEVRNLPGPIVVVCGGGSRGRKGYEFLESHGIECEYGKGWQDAQSKNGD